MIKGWKWIGIVLLLAACNNSEDDTVYVPTPTSLDAPLLFQQLLGEPQIPADNPLTEEGIALGQRLFFDRSLSDGGSGWKELPGVRLPRTRAG